MFLFYFINEELEDLTAVKARFVPVQYYPDDVARLIRRNPHLNGAVSGSTRRGSLQGKEYSDDTESDSDLNEDDVIDTGYGEEVRKLQASGGGMRSV